MLIEARAFYGCDGLKSITIPAKVETIQAQAFYACKGLVRVDILDGVKAIKVSAFEGCLALTDIVFPKTLTTLEDAIVSCFALENVYFTGTEAEWLAVAPNIENFVYGATMHFEYIPE